MSNSNNEQPKPAKPSADTVKQLMGDKLTTKQIGKPVKK